MARDKSAIAVVVIFLTLGVGALVGWIARGTTTTGPSDQAISAVRTPETSILLPRSATDDASDVAATDTQDTDRQDTDRQDTDTQDTDAAAVTGDAEPGVTTTTVVGAVTAETAASAVEQPSAPTTETAASSEESSSQNTSTTTPPTTVAPVTIATSTTIALTTIAPTASAPTTTALVLTDPSFNSVQFQSPIACTGGSAVAEIAWDTVDASTVAIVINGQSIAADLPPGGVFDANFACDADGVHDVELIATGVSSDPARAAFTSSVTDQITTEG